MNTKSTGLLLAAAALLFAFIYFVERPLRLAALDSAQATGCCRNWTRPKLPPWRFRLGAARAVIRAEKTNQLWQLTKPDAYPASGDLIADFLQELAQWDWQTSIEHPSSWEEYGLVQDQFTLLLQEDGQERTLKIGRISPGGRQGLFECARQRSDSASPSTNALRWIPTNQTAVARFDGAGSGGRRFPEAQSPLDQLEF